MTTRSIELEFIFVAPLEKFVKLGSPPQKKKVIKTSVKSSSKRLLFR